MTQKYAFFDVDGTLIRLKSMFSFHDYWYRNWVPDASPQRLAECEDISAILRGLERTGAPRETINRRYYEFFAGRCPIEVAEASRAWFSRHGGDPSLYIESTIAEMERLRASGCEPVLVSGSFHELLAPLATRLSVQHVLATRLVVRAGRYTGAIDPPQTIGEGKATAVRSFLLDHTSDPLNCWAFGDDRSDLPMLEAVGNPVAVAGDTALEQIAQNRSWPILQIESSRYNKPQSIAA